MKNFCVQLLYFLLPPIILAYAADWLLSAKLQQSNNFAVFEYPIWNTIFKGNVDAKVFIYGSSRAWVHINPGMIERNLGQTAYNFGVDGHNFGLQYFRHKMLLKYNKTPKIIIHSVDMFTLTQQKDLYNFQQFLPYMLNDSELENYLIKYNGFEQMDFKIPMLRYRLAPVAIKEVFGQLSGLDANVPVRINGFQSQDRVWDGKFEEAKRTLKIIAVPIDLEMVKQFDDYLSDCNKRNIKVILVYTPEYIEGQLFEKNREEVISLYKNWAEKHNIPYLDYSKDRLTLDRKYFYNATHMNKMGTDLFNKTLVSDLKMLPAFN